MYDRKRLFQSSNTVDLSKNGSTSGGVFETVDPAGQRLTRGNVKTAHLEACLWASRDHNESHIGSEDTVLRTIPGVLVSRNGRIGFICPIERLRREIH